MSADDLLCRASRALRDDGDELTRVDAALLRARVLDTARKGERRRGRVVLLVLPIAAVLAASTALARNGAARRTWAAITEYVTSAPEKPAATPAPPSSPRAAPRVLPAPVPADSAPSVDPEPITPPPPPAPKATRPPAPIAAPAAPKDDAETTALAAYERAHRLHFVDRNYAAAVGAWDDYLRAAPGGRLSAEARYNRALALVHLGREAEAKEALLPFSRGEVAGGYKKDEARALVQALR
jgi:hypothetical protein